MAAAMHKEGKEEEEDLKLVNNVNITKLKILQKKHTKKTVCKRLIKMEMNSVCLQGLEETQ